MTLSRYLGHNVLGVERVVGTNLRIGVVMRSRFDLVRRRRSARKIFQIETLEDRLNLSGDGVVADPEPIETPGEYQCDGSVLGVAPGPTAKAATAVNCFALDSYLEFNRQSGNVLLSPLSISTALAMTAAGADGQTAIEMQDVLYIGDDPAIHESYRALLGALDHQGEEQTELAIANALWPKLGAEFHEEYLDLIGDQYGGYAQSLDFFGDPDSYQVINEWAHEQTGGNVSEIFSGPLDPRTKMVLTNSIHFEGNWAVEFNRSGFGFQLEDGTTIAAPLISTEYDSTEDTGPPVRYSLIDDHQVASVPYGDGETSMVIILPGNTDHRIAETDLFPIENDLTINDLSFETLAKVNRWLNEPPEDFQVVSLSMPKFTTTVESNLVEFLKGMGMPTAFEFDAADFSNATDISGLAITDVVHEAFIDVNEKGTEASAVTAVVQGGICFAKGTPVRTSTGTKLIEEIEVGDEVLSRSDADLGGSIRPKRVEELFRSTKPVIEVHVNGQVIRATEEHPFFVQDKGWVAANKLEQGDQLACDVSSWKAVERITDNGEVTDVYNFRVAGFHTYFVGSDTWGFSVWTHNCCCEPDEMRVNRPFHYFIRDNATSSILFMGRVMDPSQTENSLAPEVEPARPPATAVLAPLTPDPPNIPVRPPTTIRPVLGEEGQLLGEDGRLLGDADSDGSVSFVDFLVVANNFGSTTAAGDQDGDFTRDGFVDFADFLLLSFNFGEQLA